MFSPLALTCVNEVKKLCLNSPNVRKNMFRHLAPLGPTAYSSVETLPRTCLVYPPSRQQSGNGCSPATTACGPLLLDQHAPRAWSATSWPTLPACVPLPWNVAGEPPRTALRPSPPSGRRLRERSLAARSAGHLGVAMVVLAWRPVTPLPCNGCAITAPENTSSS